MGDIKPTVTASPHLHSKDSIQRIMQYMCVALSPAIVAAFYHFGLKALAIIVISVTTCVLSEFIFQRALKRRDTSNDFSAAVTGILLAFTLPVSAPIWVPIIGGVFAIVVVKMLFGGLGQNFVNPALAARAFLQIAYPSEMIAWTAPVTNHKTFYFRYDAVSSATPLETIGHGISIPEVQDYINVLTGNHIAGSLGETCAAALIIGGIYLLIRKVISWHIPVSFLGTFFILTVIFGREGLFTGFPVYELLIGGILLGAFFMATDHSTSPLTKSGKLIMGCGCGLLTFIIRFYGGYPEGVCYAILLMNLCVPLIDKFTKPRVFGVQKGRVKNNG